MLRLIVSAATAFVLAQTSLSPSPAVVQFIAAAQDYAALHHRIENGIAPLPMNARPEAIELYLRTMTDAMRAARADARQGDFFTPALAAELRVAINSALLEHGFTAADVRNTEDVEGVDLPRVTLRINGTFPWNVGASMFPCMINALPPLPPELQYRIVGNDLLLIDVHASLILDILPRALADMMVMR